MTGWFSMFSCTLSTLKLCHLRNSNTDVLIFSQRPKRRITLPIFFGPSCTVMDHRFPSDSAFSEKDPSVRLLDLLHSPRLRETWENRGRQLKTGCDSVVYGLSFSLDMFIFKSDWWNIKIHPKKLADLTNFLVGNRKCSWNHDLLHLFKLNRSQKCCKWKCAFIINTSYTSLSYKTFEFDQLRRRLHKNQGLCFVLPL